MLLSILSDTFIFYTRTHASSLTGAYHSYLNPVIRSMSSKNYTKSTSTSVFPRTFEWIRIATPHPIGKAAANAETSGFVIAAATSSITLCLRQAFGIGDQPRTNRKTLAAHLDSYARTSHAASFFSRRVHDLPSARCRTDCGCKGALTNWVMVPANFRSLSGKTAWMGVERWGNAVGHVSLRLRGRVGSAPKIAVGNAPTKTKTDRI